MRKVEVLRGVSLEVGAGSIFGFLGPNGAGKTTLIQLLVGIRKPTSGEVRVEGHLAHTTEAKRKSGFLPERPYFYDFLTGERLLEQFGRLGGQDSAVLKKRVPRVLELVGMTQAARIPMRKYSKGMLQRIGIAQALLRDPKIVVLDEPMSGLDPLGRREVRELILRLKGEGKTVFFSSHVIPDVEAVCDHVAVIQKGKIVSSGRLAELLADRIGGVEIVFSGVDIAQARRMHRSATEIAEGIQVRVPDSESANTLLAQVIQTRGVILSMSPVRPSLEDLVVEKKRA